MYDKIDASLDEIYEVMGFYKGLSKNPKERNNVFHAYVLSENQAKIAIKTLKAFAEKAPDCYGDMQFKYVKASEAVASVAIKDERLYYTSGKKAAEEFDYIICF